jgi:hypothetical protein
MSRAALCSVAVLALLFSSAIGHAGRLHHSSPQATGASRIVDRTLRCATAFVGGTNSIAAKGRKGTGRTGGVWGRPALVSASTGAAANGGPRNPTILDNSLVWITAGRPAAESSLVEETILSDLYRTRLWGTLAVNTRLCRDSTKRVALSSDGLRGQPLGSFEASSTCFTPRRVLMRVRAVLTSPAVLRRFRDFGRATVPVRSGTFVIQTETGKRLAYAEVSDSGKARQLTAASCFPS